MAKVVVNESAQNARGKLERIEFSAVVIRKDGKVEDLGVIAQRNFTIRAKIKALINKFRSKGSK